MTDPPPLQQSCWFKPALIGTFEKEDLKIEFRNMHKNDKETNTGFLKQMEQKLAYLQLHNLHLSDTKKSVALLEGLRSEYLIQPVVQLWADCNLYMIRLMD